MNYDWNDEPNKGIGQYIIVSILAFIEGCYRYGFGWLGLKAILFAMAVATVFSIGSLILEAIIDKFKG